MACQQMRSKPLVYRAYVRRALHLEPVPGIAALIKAHNLCCPDCGDGLAAYDVLMISEHLCSCGSGGGWQHCADATNLAVKECFTDVHVTAKLEGAGNSPGSAHRPGDVTSANMPVPLSFPAGGTHALILDSGIKYFTASSASVMARKPGWGAMHVEGKKLSTMAAEIAAGKRAPLRSDGTFQPLGVDSRGRTGDGFPRMMEWLAEYAVLHSNLMDAPGMTAGALTARLVTRWRTRLSVALHRALAEVYLQRAEKIRAAAAQKTGVVPLSLVDVLLW
jgi:hypothetical protein